MAVHLSDALPGGQRRLAADTIAEAAIRLCGVSSIAVVGLILVFLLREALPTFDRVSLGNLLGTRWYPPEALYGMLPLVAGSLLVTAIAVVLSVPLGLVTAVYLAEVAPRWLRDVLKPLIEILAGIPSIVLGFVGWVALAPIIQALGAPTGLTALTGGLVLGYMALPTIISIAEDALDAVPRGYREAAWALGATSWQATYRVTVPAARSGLVMAAMLGIGRAVGETMAVLMVTGNAANVPSGPQLFLQPVRTMTATIAAEMGEVARGSTHYHVLFTVALVLFAITLAINAVTTRLAGGRLPRRVR